MSVEHISSREKLFIFKCSEEEKALSIEKRHVSASQLDCNVFFGCFLVASRGSFYVSPTVILILSPTFFPTTFLGFFCKRVCIFLKLKHLGLKMSWSRRATWYDWKIRESELSARSGTKLLVKQIFLFSPSCLVSSRLSFLPPLPFMLF